LHTIEDLDQLLYALTQADALEEDMTAVEIVNMVNQGALHLHQCENPPTTLNKVDQ
jgi:hypothetical protein